MATEIEIEKVWNLLNLNYSYFERDKTDEQMTALLVLWKRLLSDIPGDVLEASAIQHVTESKWFPAIAELRDMAIRIMSPQTTTAIEAWGEVIKNFHCGGIWTAPTFSDPIVAQVVQQMGWQNLCLSECEEASRARFIEGYNAIQKRNRQEIGMHPLVRQAIGQGVPLGLECSTSRAELPQSKPEART